MAAVDPSESPKRQKSPAEEVDTSGERTAAVESGRGVNRKDETPPNKTTESPGDERRTGVGVGGGCAASHSEVSVESAAGADETTGESPEDPVEAAEKMAEAPGGEQRAFDWSEPEDDGGGGGGGGGEAKRQKQENGKCGSLAVLMYFTVSLSVRG